ncbi:MAG: hypothetical protein IPN40_09710 [Uliginosibacterium sp.]|nr:hypothetical protein [Uliginosibacterium sp.]
MLIEFDLNDPSWTARTAPAATDPHPAPQAPARHADAGPALQLGLQEYTWHTPPARRPPPPR